MMKRSVLLIITILVFIGCFVIHEKLFKSSSPYNNFSTAFGNVGIEEVNRQIFKKYGYLLIKNDLIPILKRIIPQSCENIFLSWQKTASMGATINPPNILPNANVFLLNNYTKLVYWYSNETTQSSKSNTKIWNVEFIDNMIKTAKNNASNVPRYYGEESLAVSVATKYYSVQGQIGAVIGSHNPWAEAFVLANGAKHVTTVEYQNTSIDHPQLDFLHAFDLPTMRANYYDKFDFIVSFSSIEHSGLGRYGDPIDPIGDIREMNKIHCMLKPKGLLYLGFPVGVDTVVFNVHRIYGRIRLAMMFEGFRLLKIFKNEIIVTKQQMQQIFSNQTYNDQLLFVLEKVID